MDGPHGVIARDRPLSRGEFCHRHSWSRQYRLRREAAARFGKRIFDLPLVRRVREVLVASIADGQRVLEIGAGEKDMRLHIERAYPNVRYESLDIDPEGEHDYRTFNEIDGAYDCIFAFEVIEHLAIEEIPGWLAQAAAHLRPGGSLLLSTPNVFYPPGYLRDATHRTPLCYDELAGLVAAAGLTVERIVRVYHEPLQRMLLKRYLLGWLFRAIGIDFARQIVLVARK